MSINSLRDYVQANTTSVPLGSGTTTTEFFDVDYSDGVDAEVFRALVENARDGVFARNVDLFDGTERNYLLLGGWIGDQGLALRLMALGSHLELWQLLTPTSMLPADTCQELKQQMAGMGMVSIAAKPSARRDQ